MFVWQVRTDLDKRAAVWYNPSRINITDCEDMDMKEIRVGVVNWDCSLTRDTFFGYYQTRTLSPKKYREYTPYYADIVHENRIEYHTRDQKAFDLELQYAVDAGIDYFTYVYYPEQGSRAHNSVTYADVSHRVYELAYARRMHASSHLRHKIGMAFIVTPIHPMADEDLLELTAFFREPYYEKIDGRPLVYVYLRADILLMERVHAACLAQGLPAPYFVPMAYSLPKEQDSPLIEAISQYACVKSGITTYEELSGEMIRQNRIRLGFGHRVIPHFTVGWDPTPRIDLPSPWVQYPEASYAAIASPADLMQGAKLLADWVCDEAAAAFTGHILTFAWNEFEEGAWICPTYTQEQKINTDRIAAFAEISAYWKQRLLSLL